MGEHSVPPKVFADTGLVTRYNTDQLNTNQSLRVVGWEHGPCPLGPKEIDGLLVPPGKASSLLTDHLITG